jgi:quinol-cytochrome oxidoreductase complex cytochrome b subunit
MIPSKVLFMDGEVLGVLAFSAAGLVWVLLPFLERRQWHMARAFITGLAVLAVAYIASMTVYGYVAK